METSVTINVTTLIIPAKTFKDIQKRNLEDKLREINQKLTAVLMGDKQFPIHYEVNSFSEFVKIQDLLQKQGYHVGSIPRKTDESTKVYTLVIAVDQADIPAAYNANEYE